MSTQQKSAAERFRKLEIDRQPFMDRARDASSLTVPHLFPPEGHSASSSLFTPYQSLGSRGVNNLASKLLLAMMPPNSPFFQLTVDDYSLSELANADARSEVEDALSTMERATQTYIEQQQIRPAIYEAFRHLIVSGNVLVYQSETSGLKVYQLDRYVVERDGMGGVSSIIVKETIHKDKLPEKHQKLLENESSRAKKYSTSDLYTLIEWDSTEDAWVVHQELAGTKVPESEGKYPKERNPWIPLRWSRISGENYGRGYIEEYLGDLHSLEQLSKAIVQGSAAAAKILFLVDPNGTTRFKNIAEAESGDIVSGNYQDVTVLQLNKYADFRIASEQINRITQQLSYAFLLNSAVQRDAERVTAEEVRYMAQEIETALGGVYSILSQEFQLPLVNAVMYRMEKDGRLPRLPEGKIKPAIVTGLEALGRGHDLQKLDVFISGLAQSFGPETLSQFMDVGDYIRRRGASLGIDMDGLVKPEEQRRQEQQAQQMQQTAEQLGPEAMRQMQAQMQNSRED